MEAHICWKKIKKKERKMYRSPPLSVFPSSVRINGGVVAPSTFQTACNEVREEEMKKGKVNRGIFKMDILSSLAKVFGAK